MCLFLFTPFNMKCGGTVGGKFMICVCFCTWVLNLEDIFCASLLTKEGSRVSYPECIGKWVSVYQYGY